MEEDVFPAPAVAGKLTRTIEARIHNDGANQDEVRAWQAELLHTFATPSYGLIDPKTGALLAKHEGPEFDADAFAAWLDEADAAWKAR
ncbi:MAG: hypothetical protein H6828_05155 [Planctomycetes bacterium]|nr:hypothetical protein [Planctomycetota bacterium]